MAIEIVDFPINSMVIFYSYVKLPEGKSHPNRSPKARLSSTELSSQSLDGAWPSHQLDVTPKTTTTWC